MGRIVKLSGGTVMDVDDKYTREYLDQRLEKAKAGKTQLLLHPIQRDLMEGTVDGAIDMDTLTRGLSRMGLDVSHKKVGMNYQLQAIGGYGEIREAQEKYGSWFKKPPKVKHQAGMRWW